MSEFNAGSIVGDLELDRSAFTRGLDEAKRQADEFARNHPTITPDVDTRVAAAELDALEQRVRDLRNPTIRPDVDTRVAAEELRLLELRIDEVTRQRTIDINERNSGSPGGGAGGGGGGRGSGDSGGGGGFPGMGLLIGAAASALPALVPLLAAATGATLALAGGMTAAGVALGSFALVAKSDLTDVNKQLKAVGGNASLLPAQIKPLGMAIEQLRFSMASLKSQTSTSVFATLTSGIHLFTGLLQGLVPIINATGKGLQGAFGILGTFLHGPEVRSFGTIISGEVGPALGTIAHMIANFGTAFIRMFEIFNPLLIRMGKAAENFSAKVRDWSGNGGLNKFAEYVYRVIPPVIALLKSIGGAFASIWKALAGGGGQSLTFLTSVFTAIKQLGPALSAIVQLLSPFEQLFIQALPALVPFVNLLGGLAKAVIPLLNSTVHALVGGLGGIIGVLSPVVRALTEFFNKIAPANKVLGIIIASFIGLKLALIAIRVVAAANPIILLLTALAAIAVVIVDHWKGFSQFWIKLWGDVSRFFIHVWDDIKGAWDATARFFERIWNDIYGFFKKYGEYILLVIAPFIALPLLVISHWGAISRFFERIWNDIYGFFKRYGAYILLAIMPIIGLPLVIAQHWNAIIGWLKATWDHVWRDVKSVWGAIIGWFERIPGWITGVFSGAANWLIHAGQDIIQGLWGGIKTVWATVIGFYTRVYSVILGFFASAIGWLLNAGRSIIQGLWNGIQAVWNTVLGFYRTVYGAIIGFFAGAISWLIGAGQSIMSGLWFGIRAAWNTVTSFLGGIVGAVTGFFSGAIGWLESFGEDLIQGFWNGIQAVWHRLTDWISSAISSIGGFFSSLLGIKSPSTVMHALGEYTMQGYHNGLKTVWEGQIRPLLDAAAREMASFGANTGGLSANARITTASSVQTAATITVSAQQAAQNAALLSRVDSLTMAVAMLPAATGTAVGDSVGGQFDKTTKQQTRDLVTAGRAA